MKVIQNFATTFEFCEGKNHRHLEEKIDLQSQTIYDDIRIPKKSTYFRRWCKGCASR